MSGMFVCRLATSSWVRGSKFALHHPFIRTPLAAPSPCSARAFATNRAHGLSLRCSIWLLSRTRSTSMDVAIKCLLLTCDPCLVNCLYGQVITGSRAYQVPYLSACDGRWILWKSFVHMSSLDRWIPRLLSSHVDCTWFVGSIDCIIRLDVFPCQDLAM